MTNKATIAGAQADVQAGQRHFLPAFARIVAPFWRTRASLRAWLLLALIAAGLIAQAGLAYYANEKFGDFTNAVVDRDMAALAAIAWILVGITVIGVLLAAGLTYVQMWIEIDWRVWLTEHLATRWLEDDNYYRIERDGGADNPDQRISEDVFLFLDLTLRLGLEFAHIVSDMIVFSLILWTLGGALTVTLSGQPLVIPGGMFFATWAVLLVIFAVMVAVAQPLIRLNVARQRKEADYRFALANTRMNAEQIALYGGALAEALRFDGLFARIVANWRRIMWMTAAVTAVSIFYQNLVPVATQFPGYDRYLSGEIDFGELTQIGMAVGALAMALSWFAMQIESSEFFEWTSAVRRLDAFDIELSRRNAGGITTTEATGQAAGGQAAGGALLELRGLKLALPDGEALAETGDLAFHAGQRWMVRGPSGAGKSTLMRAAAGLWPHGAGEVRFAPCVRETTLFLPQKSYVPAGPLIDAVAYPAEPGFFTHEQVAVALRLVRLDRLAMALDEDAVWQQRLSPGEQQRLAFARVFLHRPDVLLLDEATSALDADNEQHLYRLLAERLPDALVISIAHRESLHAFHDHQLDLVAPA